MPAQSDLPPGLAGEGTAGERFALMLHDRLVDLEAHVAGMRPAPLDACVSILGSGRRSDTGAVFVRARSARDVDLEAWGGALVAALGGVVPTRWDAWCCQHWSVGSGPYVLETLVQRSGHDRPADVAQVAHVALDALRALRAEPLAVEACAVRCPAWFAESVRAASAASRRAALHSWDPQAGVAVRQDANDGDEVLTGGAPGDPAHRAWCMLHGWLAAQVEATEVWHPHAPNASALARQLVAALGQALP